MNLNPGCWGPILQYVPLPPRLLSCLEGKLVSYVTHSPGRFSPFCPSFTVGVELTLSYCCHLAICCHHLLLPSFPWFLSSRSHWLWISSVPPSSLPSGPLLRHAPFLQPLVHNDGQMDPWSCHQETKTQTLKWIKKKSTLSFSLFASLTLQ